MLRQLKYLDELVEFADCNTEDVRRARSADEVDELIGDHFLFSCVPFLALPVDVNPYAQPLVVAQRAVRNLDRDLPVLLPALRDKES